MNGALNAYAGLQHAQAGNPWIQCEGINGYQYQADWIQKIPTQPKETKMSEKEILPDISLTRVFKWAVVMIVAMALGRKVWDTFGGKIQAQLTKALEHV